MSQVSEAVLRSRIFSSLFFLIIALIFPTLSIANNDADQIIKSLENNNNHLEIKIDSCPDECAFRLAKALRHNKTVLSLNLFQNSISDEGLASILEALKYNHSVSLLNLAEMMMGPKLGPKSERALIDLIKETSSLIVLDLWGTRLSEEGHFAIAKALETNKTLTGLNIGYNDMTSAAGKAFVAMLKKNRTLSYLSLQRNYLDEEIQNSISEIFKTNPALIFINLSESQNTKDPNVLKRGLSDVEVTHHPVIYFHNASLYKDELDKFFQKNPNICEKFKNGRILVEPIFDKIRISIYGRETEQFEMQLLINAIDLSSLLETIRNSLPKKIIKSGNHEFQLEWQKLIADKKTIIYDAWGDMDPEENQFPSNGLNIKPLSIIGPFVSYLNSYIYRGVTHKYIQTRNVETENAVSLFDLVDIDSLIIALKNDPYIKNRIDNASAEARLKFEQVRNLEEFNDFFAKECSMKPSYWNRKLDNFAIVDYQQTKDLVAIRIGMPACDYCTGSYTQIGLWVKPNSILRTHLLKNKHERNGLFLKDNNLDLL